MSDLPEGWIADAAGGFYYRPTVRGGRAIFAATVWFVSYDHWHQRWCVTDSHPLRTSPRRAGRTRYLIEGAAFATPEAAMTAANVQLAGGDT